MDGKKSRDEMHFPWCKARMSTLGAERSKAAQGVNAPTLYELAIYRLKQKLPPLRNST
jgi:hypothetical protein